MTCIAGVYKIQRNGTDHCYVGSSVDIVDRWRDHRYDFTNGKHVANRMQRTWTKYGADAFSFSILETCSCPDGEEALKKLLKEREQFWMDQMAPVYNTLKAAYSSLGFKHSAETVAKMRARVQSQETRAKLRAAFLGVKRSAAVVERIRETSTGRIKTPEQLAKAVQTRRAGVGFSPSAETRAKISKTLTGVKLSPERAAKNRPFAGRKHSAETIAKMTGRKQTPEAIEKSRIARTGRKATPEQIEKIRRAKLGTVTRQETKEKLRQALLGRKHSPEAIANMRKPKSPEHAAKLALNWTGRKHSAESKEKMRVAALARRERERLERENSTP